MQKTNLRASQFITTYGVGAMIDGKNGPCVILDFNNSGFFELIKSEMPEELIISYPGMSRLSRRLKYYDQSKNISINEWSDLIGIFEVPTNAKFQKKDTYSIYKIKRFPNWALCNRHKEKQILYPRNLNGGKCPLCLKKEGSISPKADKEAIRFIQICPNGHLTDVQWKRNVHFHSKNYECKPTYLEWYNKGVDKDHVIIQCPQCKSSISLGELLRSHPNCPGTFPEKGEYGFIPQRCDKKTLITQRNASNVFTPNIITSISIPLEANALYKILNVDNIKNIIKRNRGSFSNFNNFKEKIKNDTECGIINVKHYNIIDSIPKNEEELALEIINYFLENFIKEPEDELSEIEFRLQEFQNFHERKGSISLEPTLIIDNKRAINFDFEKLTFSVIPIPRLEVIMVQEGYRRICSFPGSSEVRDVYTPYIADFGDLGECNWYPGVILNGEGIFIELNNPQCLIQDTELYMKWEMFHRILEKYKKLKESKKAQQEPNTKEINNILKLVAEDYEFKDQRDLLSSISLTKKAVKEIFDSFSYRNLELFTHPIAIWWHTIAHRIIKSISKDCGYSTASIRERIYYDKENNRGGILIYACRPGEDGTMGGIVSLMPQIERLIRYSIEDLDLCSNDPICKMTNFELGEVNGSACYSCLYLPETSCEFGNIGLDRNLLLEVFDNDK